MQVFHRQLAAYRVRALHGIFALGHNLAPVVATRIGQVYGDDAAVLRLPVGRHVCRIAGQDRVKARRNILHHGLQVAMVGQVLNVDFAFVGG